MRLFLTGVASATLLATAAYAQDTDWGFFEDENGVMQAGVQSSGGDQLILKCNEPGDRSVFALIYTPEALGAPSTRASIRDVTLLFDGSTPRDAKWRYYQNTVEAVNTRRDRALIPFLESLADASHIEVRLDPVDGARRSIEFDVAGARDAIGRVYDSCGDQNPLG
ncbi:hypothetical protein GCM10009127_07150 [Alteraurantiacibacter aestuarii]|uniref:Uncharacterized protein n=1 Tax=Alteraurantiacibacter aestuarii TaxID=650004 RepID=A0A844ZPC5_9SPHN|nr:hypothetical protein [Alteraurantiacibacter aestuarii]MXO89192.1 hypothetical protein [Alteraurantiacibacter aestuarii]